MPVAELKEKNQSANGLQRNQQTNELFFARRNEKHTDITKKNNQEPKKSSR